MIAIRDLVAHAGPFSLRSVSLEVPTGELLVLLGPSGAGKTLLLESTMGLRRIDRGQVTIDGRDVTLLPPEERHIAYMPQDVALFPHLSVLDNVLFGRRVRGTMAGAEADLDRLSGLLHVRHLLSRSRIGSLSGGERQRVALARALVTNPRALVLDESFSALDAHIRRQLLVQLRELQQTLRLTVLYVTHNQGEASVVGDRVAVLMAGRVVQVDTPASVFRRPADLQVARFLQVSNLFPADAVDGSTCRVRGVPLALGHEYGSGGARWWVGVAAEDIVVLRPGEAERLEIRVNRLRGRVERIDLRHARTRAQIALGDGELVLSCELTARERLSPAGEVRLGEEVEVHLPPEALSVFPEEVA